MLVQIYVDDIIFGSTDSTMVADIIFGSTDSSGTQQMRASYFKHIQIQTMVVFNLIEKENIWWLSVLRWSFG